MRVGVYHRFYPSSYSLPGWMAAMPVRVAMHIRWALLFVMPFVWKLALDV